MFDFVCVDYQGDFTFKNGKNFSNGNSVIFIKETLFTFMKNHNIKASEIISDYRLPRGKSCNESCVPGTDGYKSLLPKKLRKGTQWIKCMHNPLWVRKNIGIPNKIIGEPYQDPIGFNNWINKHITMKDVVLFGESAECCLLQVASELYFRGYNVYYIYEATDPMNERLNCKNDLMYNSSISIYVKVLNFKEFVEIFEES